MNEAIDDRTAPRIPPESEEGRWARGFCRPNGPAQRFGLVLIFTLPLVWGCGREANAPTATDFFTGLAHVPSSPETTLGDDHAFESIDGLAVLDDGAEVVSDATRGRLTLFVAGREVSSFGRVGPKPEDFTALGTVTAVRADTFVVLDPNRGRLVAFRRVGDSVARIGPVVLPFHVSDVCAVGGRLFALGRFDSTLVHETTVSGGVVRSFGTLEGSTPFEIGLNAAAEIACSASAEAIAVASRVPGELRIFSPTGDLLRRDSIPSFARSRYAGQRMASPADTTSARTWNVVVGLQWLGKALLVQLGRYPENGETTLESRWLAASGRWRQGLPPWPRVFAHTEDGRLFTLSERTPPTVNVYWVRRTE